MTSHLARFAALLGLAAASGACGESLSEPLPTPPDMSELVAGYEEPTANLDKATVKMLVEDVISEIDLEALKAGLGELLSAAGASFKGEGGKQGAKRAAGQAGGAAGAAAGGGGGGGSPGGPPGGGQKPDDPGAEGSFEANDPIRYSDVDDSGTADTIATFIDGDVFLEVSRICRGVDGEETPNEAKNGSIDLTVVMSETGVEPVIWGTAKSCLYEQDGIEALINGEVRIYIGDAISIYSGLGGALVIEVIGELDISYGKGDFSFDERVDLRWVTDTNVIEQRLFIGDEADGQWLMYYVDGNTGDYGFRAANGTFLCPLPTRTNPKVSCFDTETGQEFSL